MISEFSRAVGIPELQILEGGREQWLADARHLYWKLLRDKRGFTLQQIARLNDRTHCTIRHGIIRVNDLLNMGDKSMVEMWEKVKDLRF